MTLQALIGMAKYPDNIYIGLIQQNCFDEKCWSGRQDNNYVVRESMDSNCVKEFCNSYEGIQSNTCKSNRLAVLNVNESEGIYRNIFIIIII